MFHCQAHGLVCGCLMGGRELSKGVTLSSRKKGEGSRVWVSAWGAWEVAPLHARRVSCRRLHGRPDSAKEAPWEMPPRTSLPSPCPGT